MVDRDNLDFEALPRGDRAGGRKDAFVLDRADENPMRSRRCTSGKTEQSEVVGLGGPRRENDFVGVGAYERSYGSGRAFDCPMGLPSDSMVA